MTKKDNDSDFEFLRAELDRRYQGNRYFLGDAFPGIYLKQREADVLALLLRGLDEIKIAQLMQLALRTVYFYIKNIQQKLGIFDMHEMNYKVRTSDFLVEYYSKN